MKNLNNNELNNIHLIADNSKYNRKILKYYLKNNGYLIAEIEKIGGSAKITGAGGKSDGSGMLLIFHDDKEKLTKFAQKKKLKMYPVQLGERGVILT